MPVPLKIYSLNEIGGRKNNEDAIWPLPGTATSADRLFMVCDGVGGNSHGEVASQMACQHLAAYFKENLHTEADLTPDFVEKAREYATGFFREYIAQNPEAQQMSTTLTLAYLKADSVFLAWCGDTKIFQIRSGEVVFQSEDHSLVNELVKRGEITAEEALTHPRRNVITRSLHGGQRQSDIQFAEITDIRENDYLLLCSDGITEKVTPVHFKVILGEETGEDLAASINQVCEGKTRDNYSMYLIRLMLTKKPEPVKPTVDPGTRKAVPLTVTKTKSRTRLKSPLVAIGLLILLFFGIYLVMKVF